MAEWRPEQRRGGQRRRHPRHPDDLDVGARPAAAPGCAIAYTPASPEPISATACPLGRQVDRVGGPLLLVAEPAGPHLGARAQQVRGPGPRTGRARRRPHARRSSASARGVRRSAAPGPSPTIASRPRGRIRATATVTSGALDLLDGQLDGPARGELGGGVQRGGLGHARGADLGAHHLARVRHVDRGEHGGRVGAQRGRGDRGEDAGLVGLDVDARVGAHGARVEAVLGRAAGSSAAATAAAGTPRALPIPTTSVGGHQPERAAGAARCGSVADRDRCAATSPGRAAAAVAAGSPAGSPRRAAPSSSADPGRGEVAVDRGVEQLHQLVERRCTRPRRTAVVITGWAPSTAATRAASALRPAAVPADQRDREPPGLVDADDAGIACACRPAAARSAAPSRRWPGRTPRRPASGHTSGRARRARRGTRRVRARPRPRRRPGARPR